MDDGLLQKVKEAFGFAEADPMQLSPISLAYLGDTVYENVNRLYALSDGDKNPAVLHKHCTGRANAGAQAALIRFLLPELTEEETAVYKRGRNASVATKAKHASVTEYREATGFEALIGYLYLSGRLDRIVALCKKGWQRDSLTET